MRRRKNLSNNVIIWLVLIALVGISCYSIGTSAYRDVMPNGNGPLMTHEILNVLRTDIQLNESDEDKIKEIIDRRGYGVQSFGIIKNLDSSKDIREVIKNDLIFIYPNNFDFLDIGYSGGTYGSWTFITQMKEPFREKLLVGGYSLGLYFLSVAIILYSYIMFHGIKHRNVKFGWIVFYTLPQIIAVVVFTFTLVRII